MWVVNAFYTAVINFLLVILFIGQDADRSSGNILDLYSIGTTLYSTIVLSVNIQLALVLDHWTIFHHISIWGTLFLWFLYLIVYGYLPPDISQETYLLFTSIIAGCPKYWLTLVLVTVCAVLPDFFIRQIHHYVSPADHRILQERQLGYRSQSKTAEQKDIGMLILRL